MDSILILGNPPERDIMTFVMENEENKLPAAPTSSLGELEELVQRIEIRSSRVVSLLHLEQDESLAAVQPHTFRNDVTVFFFHGSMATWKQFDYLIGHFRNKCNVVAYDAYGCGDSDKPQDPLFWRTSHYSPEELTNDAIDIFNAYATEYNIMIGHSFGTAIVAKVVNAVNHTFAELDSPRSMKSTRHLELDTHLAASLPTPRTLRPHIVASILLGTHKASPLIRHPIFFLPVFVLDAIQEILSNQFVELSHSPATSEMVKQQSKMYSQQNQMHVAKSFYSQFQWATEEDWAAVAKYPVCICQVSSWIISVSLFFGCFTFFHFFSFELLEFFWCRATMTC